MLGRKKIRAWQIGSLEEARFSDPKFTPWMLLGGKNLVLGPARIVKQSVEDLFITNARTVHL